MAGPSGPSIEETRRSLEWDFGPAEWGEQISQEILPGFDQLPDFDIRNGDPSDASSLLVRPTIGRSYYWVPVEGVRSEKAVECVDASIKSHLYHLQANPPTGVSDNLIRKAAILLGTIRAVLTKFYRLGRFDMIPGEVVDPYMRYVRAESGEMRYESKRNVRDDLRHVLTDDLNLTETERNVVSVMVTAGIGVLPVQGFSLVMTGHHYLSETDNQSRKAFSVIEKQFWRSQAVASWFNEDLKFIQDICWHKSGHPVSITLKEALATDARVAEVLRSAGAGSAASRLPALESELRAANSYITLFSTVDPLFSIFGGSAKCTALSDIVDVLKLWPKSAEDYKPPRWFPDFVENRTDAVKWLGSVLQRNSAKAAYCYGFYCALSDQSVVLTGAGTTDTLKASFSLGKLRQQSYAAYIEGTVAYQDYAAARNRKRMEGAYSAPVFDVMLD